MAWLIGHALLDQQGKLHPLRGRQLLPFLIKLELLRMEGGASHPGAPSGGLPKPTHPPQAVKGQV